jgi:hypothetical protein
MFEGSVTPDMAAQDQPIESVLTESQPVEAAQPEGDSSLETLNTSTEGEKPPKGYVPLAALHEAREKLKSFQDSQDWRSYQELKGRLDSDPSYAQYLSTAAGRYDPQNAQVLIQQLQQLQLQNKPDPYANYPQEIAEPLRKTQVLEQTVQHLMQQNQYQQQQAVYSQYVGRLNEKLTEHKVPEHWKTFYTEKAHEVAAKLNPSALAGYDARLVDQVYEQIDQQVKAIQRAERGAYVVDKSKDYTPTSTSSTGTAPKVNQRLGSQEHRANMAAELLKAIS